MFGVDLWEYGRQLTRMNELQRVSELEKNKHKIDRRINDH